MTEIETKIEPKVREAIWQYLIDHSQIQSNGYYGIQLYFLGQADFWRRVQSRMDGFSRYKIKDKERRAESKQFDFLTFKFYEKNAKRNGEIANRIDKSGTLKEKLMIWLYRKTKKYLFK